MRSEALKKAPSLPVLLLLLWCGSDRAVSDVVVPNATFRAIGEIGKCLWVRYGDTSVHAHVGDARSAVKRQRECQRRTVIVMVGGRSQKWFVVSIFLENKNVAVSHVLIPA